jgi:superoxide reductase
MDRRHFFRFGCAALGGAVVMSRLALAGAVDSSMAGGVYHTAEVPGRWSKKVLSHLPNIEVAKEAQGATVEVFTRHPIEGYQHYIVKHIVLDKDFQFVAEYMFDPMKEKEARSRFSLGSYSGAIYVLSVCNQHDTWLNVAEV